MKSGGANAREVALLALSACEKQGAWSDGYLKKAIREAGLDNRDAALTTRLCFGVLQNKLLLDFYLEQFSRLPLSRLEERVLEALRLGAYQVLFLDKIPPSAAVNESVDLARKYAKNPKAAGVVNGILRNLLRSRDTLRQPETLSIRYSHPEWLVKEFSYTFQEGELEALLDADNGQPPVCVQVNVCRFGAEDVRKALLDEGVRANAHPWLPDCLLLEDTGDISNLKAFQNGMFYVQDAAARLAVLAADPRPEMRVLDACAAPGGKSFAAAMAMQGRGEILSCDIHPHKQSLIEAGAQRLGLNCIRTAVMDGKKFDPALAGQFDLVMADVPCSGLGIIRKKPDIRYKDPAILEALPAVQRAILDNVSRYVRPGGTLLYATCTLLERENSEVVDGFLSTHPDFSPEPFTLPGSVGRCESGRLTLWPHIHQTDGFFMTRLRRRD